MLFLYEFKMSSLNRVTILTFKAIDYFIISKIVLHIAEGLCVYSCIMVVVIKKDT